jgi:hypothetical protein
MRLLRLEDDRDLSFVEFLGETIPPYAILSHTWLEDNDAEVFYEDVLLKNYKYKPGYQKILSCGKQAHEDGLKFFWVDTCCIRNVAQV